MKHRFQLNDQTHEIDVAPAGAGLRIRTGGREIAFEFTDLGEGRLELRLPDRTLTLHAAADGDTRWIAFNGRTYELRRLDPARRRRPGTAAAAEGVLRAPMPGQVRAVSVAVGDAVKKGDTLLLLEAMKMEIRIQAPQDGTVAALPVAAGQQVEREQVLITIN